MNILYIWDADYPWDVRVEKICRALADEEHTVHIASRNLKRRPLSETSDGLHIHRLKNWNNNSLNYYLSFPLFFSPIWKRFLDNIIKDNDIDLIIVRDLPMAVAGIWAGKRASIPVIFDMAEDYVAMLKDIWKVKKFSGMNLVVRNPSFAKLVEKYVVKKVDHIFIVVDEAMEIIDRNKGDVKKVTVVSNTPKLENFSCVQTDEANSLAHLADRYVAIYTGGIQMGRGIHTVIDAIPDIVKVIPNFMFVVVGEGYALENLKKLSIEKGVQDHVCWLGWIDHDRMFHYIKKCQIGLIPHLVTEHVATTIPNKLFDYMGCGLPVVASDARPMKKIIDSEQCGKTFVSGDAASLANAVCDVYHSSVDYGANAEASVRQKHNWKIDEDRMLRVVNSII